MLNNVNTKTDGSQPIVYEIKIEGHLDRQWTEWFGGLIITLEDNGNTVLTGPVADQAALYGLLKKVRDLGMPLVSVMRAELNSTADDRSSLQLLDIDLLRSAGIGTDD